MTLLEPVLVAHVDESLTATVDALTPLRYQSGGSAADDVPAHVRAGSALRRFGDRLVIVQDDVNVLAVRERDGTTHAVLLPLGPGGARVFDDSLGNKKLKMDLEASAVLPDGRLVAFGSGSTARREDLVLLEPDGRLERRPAPSLYDALRSETDFAGSQLNVEGAVVAGRALLLFQRGNSAPRSGVSAVNAIGFLDLGTFVQWLAGRAPVPRLTKIVPVDLGTLAGVRLGFTDAALLDDGRIAVIACAEATDDAVLDGPVLGCRFGLLSGRDLRMTTVLGEDGRPSPLKLEGIESRAGTRREFLVVADMDVPAVPALLGRLRIVENGVR